MKGLSKALERVIVFQESIPSTAVHIIAALFFIAVVRLGLENLPHETIAQQFIPYGVIGHVLFYVGSFFLFFLLATLFFPESVEKVRSIILIGMFAGLVPPFITPLFSSETSLKYGYFEEFSWNFFSSTQPIGEGIGLWVTIGVVGLYVLYRKKSILAAFAGFLGAYLLMQFAGWFITIPSDMLSNGLSKVRPDVLYLSGIATNFLWFLSALVAFLFIRREFFRATFKRAHYNIIWFLVILLGAQIAGVANLYTVFLGFVFMIASFFIQAENDFYDKKIDAVSSRASTITSDDLIFVRFFMVLLVSIFVLTQAMFSALLALFFLLGFVYNHPSFRLKLHFATSSFIEGGAAFLVMLAGVFTVGNKVDGSELLYILIASLVIAVLSNLKDQKDFEGDKKMGVKTLYVVFNTLGISTQKTTVALTSLLCVIYAILVVVSIYLSLASPLLVIALLLFVFSFFPFLLLNHPKKSAASTTTVTIAGLWMLFVAFGLLPLF